MEKQKQQQPDAVDTAFHISLLLKGLDGLIEVISGLLLLILRPSSIVRWSNDLVAHHPHSSWANHVAGWGHSIGKSSLLFGSIYLLSHGIVKLFVVINVWRNRSWAYPLLLVVIGAFIVYQLFYLIFEKFTGGMVALTIFDFLIVYLTWIEYQRHKGRHNFADEA